MARTRFISKEVASRLSKHRSPGETWSALITRILDEYERSIGIVAVQPEEMKALLDGDFNAIVPIENQETLLERVPHRFSRMLVERFASVYGGERLYEVQPNTFETDTIIIGRVAGTVADIEALRVSAAALLKVIQEEGSVRE